MRQKKLTTLGVAEEYTEINEILKNFVVEISSVKSPWLTLIRIC